MADPLVSLKGLLQELEGTCAPSILASVMRAGQNNLAPATSPCGSAPTTTLDSTMFDQLVKAMEGVLLRLRLPSVSRQAVAKPPNNPHVVLSIHEIDAPKWCNKTPQQMVETVCLSGDPWNKVTAARYRKNRLSLYVNTQAEEDALRAQSHNARAALGLDHSQSALIMPLYQVQVVDADPSLRRDQIGGRLSAWSTSVGYGIHSARLTWGKLILRFQKLTDALHVLEKGWVVLDHLRCDVR